MPEIPRPSEWRCKDMVRAINVALGERVGLVLHDPPLGTTESALCALPRPPPETSTGVYRGSEEG